MMNTAVTVQREVAALAIVHHANQYVVTDGYDNRVGISGIVGTSSSQTGLLRVLKLHERYRVPFSLHISGTFLESLAWHNPEFLSEVNRLAGLGLLELLGGAYAQNMTRFFSPEHNLRQMNEELLLYESLIGWDPKKITTFWPTERLWETETMAPLLTSGQLLNGGYQHVVIDDRLLHSTTGSPSPRQLYDYDHAWNPVNFQMHRIKNGLGLCALPISFGLRRNIPPRTREDLEKTQAQLEWILDINSDYDNQLVAIYADDMEKVAGVGWDARGPLQFEAMLRWLSENPFLQPVKLAEWAATHRAGSERQIDTGAYAELVDEFGAGENYESWYYDPRWSLYRNYYSWSEERVRELDSSGADPALIQLAWKTLLATTWQTAWHTPRTGAHGENLSDEGPSAWTRAIASHSRIAAIIAEAAHWMTHKSDWAYADLRDLDSDGEDELVLKNDKVFAVFSPRNGGRLVYLFTVGNPPGRLVIGNPIDDWNLLEDLHAYMDAPPNHPGALADVGFEHDHYSTEIRVPYGDTVWARLSNSEKRSTGFGILKNLSLGKGESTIRTEYSLPNSLTNLSTEIGFSPDYQQLLRSGPSAVEECSPAKGIKGWSNEGVTVGARLDGAYAIWDKPRQDRFGHGYLLGVTGFRGFTVWIGAED